MNFFLTIIFLLLTCLSPRPAHSEVLELISGKQITGTILERTGEEVKIETSLGVVVTYYLDEIASIDGVVVIAPVPTNSSVIQELSADEIREINENTTPPFEQITERAAEFTKTVQTSIEATGFEQDEFAQKLKGEAEVIRIKFDDTWNENSERVDQAIATITKRWQTRLTTPLTGKEKFVLVLLFLSYSYPLYRLANKFNVKHSWIAWVPCVQLFLLFRMTRRPLWWILFLFVPLVNIFILLKTWIDIFASFGYSPWLGFLMFVPGLNLMLLWILALGKKNPILTIAQKNRETLFSKYINSRKPAPNPNASKQQDSHQFYMPKSKNSRF